MANYPVKWYSDTMGGIPALSGTNGALTTILDAVLVNGFNVKSVTNVYINGTVAEIGVGPSHGYIKDQIISISGANESVWNTDYRVLSISGNSIFVTLESGATTPSGSLQVRTTPLGYEITHSTTNIRCYRSLDNTSRKFVLRIDDGNNATQSGWNASYTKKARVTVFRDTSAIDAVGITGDAGTGKFYTSDQMPLWDTTTNLARNHTVWAGGSTSSAQDGWFKWYYTLPNLSASAQTAESNGFAAGNRNFQIIGDSKGFWVLIDPVTSASVWYGMRVPYYFGEFDSLLGSTDINNCLLLATDIFHAANGAWQNSSTGYYNLVNSGFAQTAQVSGNGYTSSPMAPVFWIGTGGAGMQVFKDYTGLGLSKYINSIPPHSSTTLLSVFRSGYDTGITFPNGFNYTVFLSPIYFREAVTAVMRGTYPGVYAVMSNVSTNNFYNTSEVIDNVTNYNGRKFMSFRVEGYGAVTTGPTPGRIFFDITGPWRS